MTGLVSHLAGKAAESAVAAHYRSAGSVIVAERWRSSAGEIDLIARDGEEMIFIEVKKARSHDEAACRLLPGQLARICSSAELFLEGEPAGQFTPRRFDLALVDDAGRVAIIENVTMH